MATREPYQIVEIDQKFCGLTHSNAPCTADPVAVKCYNTYKTCQDIQNYTESALTLKFTQARDFEDIFIDCIPSLLSVSSTPTQINPGGSSRNKKALGIRSSVTITLQDHPHSDYFVDPYRDSRNYIAIDRGTFWTKWLARNPYYRNSVVRVIDGDLIGGTSSTRTYVIDKISGPDSRGRVTIRAKDILSLAEDERALAPSPSFGELIVDINNTVTTLRVTGATASEYPAPGFVRIGSEIISYAGVTTINATEINLTGCVRGQRETEARTADAGDRVQWCLEVNNQPVYQIINDLLTNYGNVDSAFIDLPTWQAENTKWLNPFNVSTLIAEPTGVTKLLAEICEQTVCYIWYDEKNQTIRFRAVRPATETPVFIDDENNILADSVSIERAENERYSQIWIFHGQRDPTKRLDEDNNWLKLRIAADGENPYGQEQVKKIYGRWIQTELQASSIANRLLNRYKQTPVYISFDLDGKDSGINTGDIVDIKHYQIVDQTGQSLTTRFQIILSEETQSNHALNFKAINSVYFGSFAYWMAVNAPTYATATDEEKLNGAFWADSEGLINGNEGYQWQ